MGLLQAAVGAIGGTLADQWTDFYTVPTGLTPTAALFSAVPRGQNAGRGSNTKASDGVITNGSKIVVPEGYGLVLMQDGAITGFAAEAGAYEWSSEEQDSQSIFAGDGIVSPLITTSWERFKFGGRPSAQQRAYFVTLKELPNNRFGTQSEIYWDDAYMNAQVGAITRGTYTMKIVDPILFVRAFVPAKYLEPGAVFDFTDIENDAASQLFNEVVGSLAPAFSMYTNDPSKGNRITKIQQDSVGFAQSLSAAVEQNYQWSSGRGLEIASTAIIAIEYDENTRELLRNVQRADALSGARGNSNLQASVASGFESAGENAGTGGIFGMGMAAGATGLGGLQQPVPGVGAQSTPAAPAAPAAAPAADDPMVKLAKFKQMLDAGLITQEDYDAAKAKALGL
ncbi:MAG: virion core protein (lumpy skin disease virus) [Microbacterium sp.]|uniref:SPFH domain-containing protein n=1 Tax=Microbacterium aquimaris TaxID=459816 RepID=UPI000C8CC29C|nr:SPFH domain-containing protein [Microbacterium aquimaris]MAP63121.1 virion core protein (lumpy skin disease virus) [Microbacterium sp.]MDZ8275553.1 SPFH domain-containing protein [Microbacterium aquimaris]